jgi:hypothetical protein
VQFTLPHTDQAGFQDEAGNAYQNWYYTATIQYQSGKVTKPAFTKVFQLAVGQTTVDLDLLPSGSPAMPYTAPVATVTSVNGQNGAITVAESTDAGVAAFVQGSGPTATALNATYAPAVGSANYATPAAVTAAVTPKLDSATAATTYTARARMTPNAKDYGAVGDNTSRLLSSQFSTLAAAQAIYPAATALTDELDWAAIQSCINANGAVFIPAGTYIINKTITASQGVIIGAQNYPMTKLYMTGTNLPILSLTTGANISNLRLTYSAQQTSAHTESDAVRLFNIGNGSTFEKIRVDFAARGIFNYGGGYTYSSSFRDISIGYCSITSFDIRNGGGITGNVVSNLYTHNNPIDETTTNVSSEPPIQLSGWDDGVLTQINIEHTQSSAAIAIGNCLNLTIQGMHVEGFTLLGNFNAVVNTFSGNTQVSITGMSVIFSKFLIGNIPTSNSFALFKITDGIKLLIQNLQERSNTFTAVGGGFVFNSSGVTTGTVNAHACKLSGFGGNTNCDATKVSTIASLNNSRNYSLDSGKYTLFQDAAPTSYTWAVGDRVVVKTPVEAGTAGSKYIVVGYRCVTAGTPGTWLPERVLTGN